MKNLKRAPNISICTLLVLCLISLLENLSSAAIGSETNADCADSPVLITRSKALQSTTKLHVLCPPFTKPEELPKELLFLASSIVSTNERAPDTSTYTIDYGDDNWGEFKFTQLSTNSDGLAQSNWRAPVHLYKNFGKYQVKLCKNGKAIDQVNLSLYTGHVEICSLDSNGKEDWGSKNIYGLRADQIAARNEPLIGVSDHLDWIDLPEGDSILLPKFKLARLGPKNDPVALEVMEIFGIDRGKKVARIRVNTSTYDVFEGRTIPAVYPIKVESISAEGVKLTSIKN